MTRRATVFHATNRRRQIMHGKQQGIIEFQFQVLTREKQITQINIADRMYMKRPGLR